MSVLYTQIHRDAAAVFVFVQGGRDYGFAVSVAAVRVRGDTWIFCQISVGDRGANSNIGRLDLVYIQELIRI